MFLERRTFLPDDKEIFSPPASRTRRAANYIGFQGTWGWVLAQAHGDSNRLGTSFAKASFTSLMDRCEDFMSPFIVAPNSSSSLFPTGKSTSAFSPLDGAP